MQALIISLAYCLLISLLSLIQGVLSQYKAGERKKKISQTVTVQFVSTLVNVGYAILLLKAMETYIQNYWICILAVIAIVCYLQTILHRIFLKIGIQKGKSLAPLFEPIMGFLYLICTPFTFFLRIPISNEDEVVTEEDIKEMINTSQISGHMEEPQKELFENVFKFDDTSVEEICTHRNEVINLFLEDDEDTWKQVILAHRHTFYPVCKEDADGVVGVLDTRDYFRLGRQDQDYIVSHALDKPLFVLENTKVDDCFREMKKRKYYFAIVIDEYGGMSGIVTLHDIVETILGEMYEEEDVIEPQTIQQLDSNTYRIYGSADLEDVQESLGIPFPLEEYDTFSGYILGQYGSIPDDGEKFDIKIDNLEISVREMKNHRVQETIVNVIKQKEEKENEATSGSN